MTSSNDTRHQRNAQIADDHYDQGLSYEECSAKYGLSTSSIRNICKSPENEGRERAPRARDARITKGADPLSMIHKRIGLSLVSWRNQRGTNFTETLAAGELNMSRDRYGKLEKGLLDYTVSDILTIASLVGETPQALVTRAFRPE